MPWTGMRDVKPTAVLFVLTATLLPLPTRLAQPTAHCLLLLRNYRNSTSGICLSQTAKAFFSSTDPLWIAEREVSALTRVGAQVKEKFGAPIPEEFP